MKFFVRTTDRSERGWPRFYTTYHQELEEPYRYAARAHVIRLRRKELVIGRWTNAWFDEDRANTVALGARPIDGFWDARAAHAGDSEPDDGSAGCLVA